MTTLETYKHLREAYIFLEEEYPTLSEHLLDIMDDVWLSMSEVERQVVTSQTEDWLQLWTREHKR